MKRLTLMLPALLAACHSQPTVTAQNASAAEVAAKLDAAGGSDAFVNPGHWKMTMTINDMTIPNMPPAMAQKMKGAMANARTFESCLTPEEAKKPKEGFFAGSNNQCRYEHFTMGGGKIDAAMQCNEQMGSRTMKMTGTYGGDAYHMTIASTGSGAANNPAAGMSMTMTMDAKRTGECTGKEDS